MRNEVAGKVSKEADVQEPLVFFNRDSCISLDFFLFDNFLPLNLPLYTFNSRRALDFTYTEKTLKFPRVFSEDPRLKQHEQSINVIIFPRKRICLRAISFCVNPFLIIKQKKFHVCPDQ